MLSIIFILSSWHALYVGNKNSNKQTGRGDSIKQQQQKGLRKHFIQFFFLCVSTVRTLCDLVVLLYKIALNRCSSVTKNPSSPPSRSALMEDALHQFAPLHSVLFFWARHPNQRNDEWSTIKIRPNKIKNRKGGNRAARSARYVTRS